MATNNNTTKKGSGFLSGLLFLVIGVGLLWFNEGRTVKTQSAINEAKKSYIDVSSAKVDSKNDGKLVSTKGKIDLSESNTLTDSKFGINQKAAKLLRTVEMYQWDEKCEKDDNDKETCSYEKVWEDKLIDSSDFKEAGHSNPSEMPYETESFVAENVKLGAFYLPEELIGKVSYNKKKDYDDLVKEYNNSVTGIKVDGNYLTNVVDDPKIGDVRISYKYLDEITVSVMGVQRDNSFEAFTSKKGKDIYTIVKGNKTGIQILEQMVKSNKTMKWFLRILGVFLVISAFNSMFSLITTLANKVPVLGGIIGGATNIVTTILGIAVSLVVIAIAWFRFRPVLSISLIAIGIGLVVFLKVYKKPETKKVTKK